LAQSYFNGGLVHFDVCGPDINSLERFYVGVLGWTAQRRGPGYAQLGTPLGGPDGALVESATASLTIGVAIANLASALDAAVVAGGLVTMPMTDNGWVVKAQVSDPAGNLLTLIQA
jgi:predicted enzyme related to lactoylglutathione lyase